MDVAALLPLFKLAAVFGLVILLLRLSLQVGLALALGAATLGVLFSMSPPDILQTFGSTLVEGKSIALTLIVTLILILSNSMERLGHMDELLAKFRKWVGKSRFGLVVFPALIGLLPMPGGAVFSAPMVDAFDREKQVTRELKSFLNYWFRHIWEYCWPLYPSILLTCSVADLNMWHYILLAWPITILAVVLGFPHLLSVPRFQETVSSERQPLNDHGAWHSMCPLGLAVFPGLGLALLLHFSKILPEGFALPHETGFIGGLLAAVAWTWTAYDLDFQRVRQILFDRKLVRMWVTIAGVFVFKGVIEQSGAARDLGKVLLHLEIPLTWVVVLLPMIMGSITGWTIAYVGTTFPILVPLIQVVASPELMIPLIILAFVSGFTGVLMSPLHLCLILSNEHFGASWSGVYRYLWFPSSALLAGSIGYFWILKGFMG